MSICPANCPLVCLFVHATPHGSVRHPFVNLTANFLTHSATQLPSHPFTHPPPVHPPIHLSAIAFAAVRSMRSVSLSPRESQSSGPVSFLFNHWDGGCAHWSRVSGRQPGGWAHCWLHPLTQPLSLEGTSGAGHLHLPGGGRIQEKLLECTQWG